MVKTKMAKIKMVKERMASTALTILLVKAKTRTGKERTEKTKMAKIKMAKKRTHHIHSGYFTPNQTSFTLLPFTRVYEVCLYYLYFTFFILKLPYVNDLMNKLPV